MSYDIGRYIPKDHEPNGRTQRALLHEVYEQVIRPFPSVQLPNFKNFNLVTGGFRVHEYTILCGATGTGKTTLCANISAELSELDVPHYVASIETGPHDFLRRVMSRVRGKDWNTGENVPVEDVKRFWVEHGSKLERENVWLGMYDNRVKAETMLADLAFYVLHHGIKIAIIDNFNFMLESVSSTNQVKEEDRVMHEYVMFCKRVPVHLLMVHHPKKTDHGRVESEFDVKGSSTAVQEAQNVLLWNRPHPELIKAGTAEAGDRELKIAKIRRRGKFVGRRLIFRATDSVSYREVSIV